METGNAVRYHSFTDCHDEIALTASGCCRAEALREELPAAMAELPSAGDQERQHLGRRRGAHHQAPQAPRQQVPILTIPYIHPPAAL